MFNMHNRFDSNSVKPKLLMIAFTGLALFASGCAHGVKTSKSAAALESLSVYKPEEPQLLRLKADPKRQEQVAYFHRSNSVSYEDNEVRHQKEETLEFTSQAETLSLDESEDRFTQIIRVIHKDGAANMYDFAMPEPGEKLEIVADSLGRIYKAGQFPDNSIFYVPPVSLPENKVEVGETWTMQSSWLSLGDMIPYQLDMVSILKRFVKCGEQKCAEIEISGEVTLQGAAAQVMQFKSVWRGNLLFNIDAGTVVWSRVDSDESFSAGNVRRLVGSCLEALIIEPKDLNVLGEAKPKCEPLPKESN